ncbi:MAG: tetratricopeptide repeat protein [Planctomycetota bacterium]|jgi:tetratricopeptide (TPR) repeat protein|nr:tetratricopeptide repeat protein [Planctomycetota bacterium]
MITLRSKTSLLVLLLMTPIWATGLYGCASNDKPGESDEERLALYSDLALQYYNMGDLDRAQGQAEQGLAIDEDCDKLALILGWIHQRRGKLADIQRAEAIFRSLQDGGDYRARLGLAEALERKGLALDEASVAVADGSRFTSATDPQARAHELASSATAAWAESLTEYDATLELQPGNWDALNGSMRVCSLLARPADSLLWARRLLDTTEIEATFWRRQLERGDLSAPDERRFRKLMQSAADLQVATHMHAAATLKALGRTAQALEHMDAVVELDPDLREAWSRRAQLLMAQGDFSEAQQSLDQFLRRSPDFDDPAVRQAYSLLSECEAAITAAAPR